MNNIKKDFVILYMLRNFLGTFAVVMCAFILAISSYYDCTLIETVQRIFVNDIFTLAYFMLLWVFDYLIFEASKIICDIYAKSISIISISIVGICAIICLLLPITALFKYDFCFLLLLIALRMFKQFVKKDRSINN